MGRVLACQEQSCSEDEGSGDEDALMDVWAYQERYAQKQGYTE